MAPSDEHYHRTTIRVAALMMIAILIIAWFVVVDKSSFVHSCPSCLRVRIVRQYRILGMPIDEQVSTYNTLITAMSEQLGVPCSHGDESGFHETRYWGLLICASPCLTGRYTLGDDLPDWYDEEFKQFLKEFRKKHPEIVEDFNKRVIVDHDFDFWEQFVDNIKQSAESQHDGQ